MKIFTKLLLPTALVFNLYAQSDVYLSDNTKLPDLKMPNSKLPFDMIEGYQNYKIVATHFRTDKNEIRYILANPTAYSALKDDRIPLPDGSKIVKIGWSVKKMLKWDAALEADKIMRVEYMVKNSKIFNHNGDNWGYARFVKSKEKYIPWGKGDKGCISCHSSAKDNDYLFTKFQHTF